jgi:hypothetical protein
VRSARDTLLLGVLAASLIDDGCGGSADTARAPYGGRGGWPGDIHQHRNRQPAKDGSGRTAEQRDELAARQSITWSADACSVSGMTNPSALAVLRLIVNSNFVGCCTGKSAGLAPLRMRST